MYVCQLNNKINLESSTNYIIFKRFYDILRQLSEKTQEKTVGK